MEKQNEVTSLGPRTLLHEAFEAQVDRTPEALAVVGEDERLTYRELDSRGRPVPPPIGRVEREERLPLSFSQERFWLMELMDGDRTAYNVCLALRLEGRLAAAALEAGLRAIVDRHEALRTRIAAADGEPFLEILPAVRLELPRIDLAGLPAGAREAEIAWLARAEAHARFDLSRAPLLRARLIHLGADENAFLVTIHHAVFDGWSQGVLNRKLTELYAAVLEGRPAVLPALPVQYADFVAWQRSWLRGEVRERVLAWWRDELEGARAVLALPLDRPRPEVQRYRGSLVGTMLPAALAGTVAALARREGATPFMVLLAAFQAVLGRVDGMTGAEDFLVGSPFANRPCPELEGLIGLFVETLPLRARLEGDPPFRDLIARARESTLRAFAHQDLPLDGLITGLGLERVTSHNLLVQVLFSLQDGIEEGFALPGLHARPINTGLTTPRLDLSLFVETAGGELRASLEFDASLFEEETARRLLTGYLTLLTAAAGDPATPLSKLPFLSPADEAQLRARSVPAWHASTASAVRIPAVVDRFMPAAELVARIWCDLLGLDSVEHDDNFFHLGGHSLLAARVRARVRDVFGLDLTVQTLFRSPTVAGLAAVIAGAFRGSDRPVFPPLRRAPREGRLPLSFGQERFQFLGGLDAGGAAYNVPLGLLLDGALDTAGLEAALRGIVGRHEALRTRFTDIDGISFQEIAPEGGPELPRIDLAALPEGARTAELARLAHREAMAPFDLSRTPLRSRLVRLGAEAHAFLLTFHHAVFDGWSQAVFGRELAALYAAAMEGRPAELPELPVQYADYAVWQRGWLTSEVMGGLLSWWRRELDGAPRLLELPTDRPRPQAQAFRGATVSADLPGTLANGVASLARQAGATRFMVLLAAFQTLLGRLSGQDDLLVGSPFANRPRAELDGVIGLFVETLAMRGRLAGDPPFAELLSRVRETALGVWAHQNLPFERLVAGLGVERSPAYSPLIQVLFSLQGAAGEGFVLPGLEVRPLAAGTATAKFDLMLIVEETPTGLRAALEYDTDLFEGVTALRTLDRFLTVVEGVLRDPAARLSEVPVLAEAERHQLQVEWNDTAVPVAAGLSVLRQVEEQARRTPDALAVVRGDRRMTYGELDLQATRLARRLVRLGVGPEVRVAICLPRSPEGVASLLAVWKAGGTYMALDPTHPVDRLAGLLEDAAACVLITRGPLAEELSRPGLHILDPLEGDDQGSLPLEAPANAGAFIVYTSGSTGRPKGVEIDQRALLNFVTLNRRATGVGPADRVTLVSRVAWDGAVFDIWPTLTSGASLHAPEDEVITAPEALRDWMVAEGITVSFLTTPLAELLVTLPWPEGTALRYLQAGGDALRRRPLPSQPFVFMNHYGPTETTVIVTGVAVAAEGGAQPTIGRPLGNVRASVVDRGFQAVPAGVPGELCIAGVQVGRGYLGSPDLTAQRFIPEPFAGEPGARMYRTGDLVRFRLDGEIEFLSRIDRQVKLRGNRLELGEIEAAMTRHPALRDAAVLVDETGPGGRRLVAFWVVRHDREAPPPMAEEIAAFLRRTLPEYMVPALFVPLDGLPLSPNGKIDRRALAALIPEISDETLESAGTPVTQTEELLAQIWCQVLGVEAVTPRDDFFQLGGHSLLTAGVISRIRETFGVELPLQAVFLTPTVAGLAAAVDEALRGEGLPVAPPLRRAPRGGRQPLSFAQEGLWFIWHLDPESPVYNVPLAWRLRGPLDTAALEAALEAVVVRHEVLRTLLVQSEGQPFQAIAPPAPGLLPRIDLSGLPDGTREEEMARVVRAEAGRPFHLSRGPLLRARLAHVADNEHVLLLTFHHAVFDGWSTGILTREMAAFYEAATMGRAPLLAEPPVQYSDFAVWQRSWLQGEVLDRLLGWWRAELSGAPRVLELPTDWPRPPEQTFRGAWEVMDLPSGLAAEVLALGRRAGATAFMTLLAAFQVLLHRLSDQDDILLGSPVANRPRPEHEALIGYFVDSVVLRGRFQEGETFPRRLARVRETVLGAFSHQDLPFARLVAELQAGGDPSRSPIFQAMFALDEVAEPVAFPGVTVEALSTGEPSAKYDLSLGVVQEGSDIRFSLEHNLDLFDPATARRFLERLTALLEAVTAEPGRSLDALPLLSAAETGELLAEAERTTTLSVPPRRLHDLFTEQAARAPDELAVLTPAGERLTYAGLDRRSDLVARFLIGRGLAPEVPVGVCLERSPELVTALLGVLKAGGVYLPLDPEYPADRLAFMVEDSGAALVLTRQRFTGRLPADLRDIVAVDGPEGLLSGPEDQERVDRPLPADTPPESLAYLIYTSGSTGRPKGVGIPHALAAAHMEIVSGLFTLRTGDRLLQFSSPSFDMSMEEILAPLTRGATVVLRNAELWDPAVLLDRLNELGVTLINLPTAYWHQWAADCEHATPPADRTLRLVILGGEAMSGEAARRWLRSPLGDLRLINGYGPTEGVVTSTAVPVDAALVEDAGVVAIGRAILGRSTWVLDRFGHPVPDGIPGELCLGGPMLARGYLGRPELTAEKFVPDPFSGEPGARLYHTGDRALRRAGGMLEFLGRIDRQLKVRGFRVEPGEIESALARHPGVREAVVDARPDASGGQRLVAWILPAEPAPSVTDLDGFARGALPDHMVPSAFVVVAELPLTPNGKVDRRALPDPVHAAVEEEEELPRTPTEERLVEIWKALLGLPRVGIRDSFFALGGHSLLATRLLSRVRDAFGVEIPVRALFSAPTVEGLAAWMDAALPRRAPEPVAMLPDPAAAAEDREESVRQPRPPLSQSPIVAVPRGGLLPLSFPQQRLWFVERLAPDSSTYNIPSAFRLTGRLDPEALGAALGEIVRRHEVLRTRYVERDGQPWQEVLPAAPFVLPRVDLAGLPAALREAELGRLGREESGRSFDLTVGPLRASLVRLGGGGYEGHELFVTVHHIASDGWSEEILRRELAALYAAFLAGEPSPLPEPAIQYADFAAWQRAWPDGVLADQLAYWTGKLSGLATLEVPTDRPRPPLQTFHGDNVRLSVPPEAAARVRAAGREQGVTLFMLLFAAWQTLFHRITGQTDVAIGTPVANRGRSEIEGLIGFFINMLALRTDFGGDPGFAALLERVRWTALEAYDHADVPFERLVDELRLERDLSRQPLVQVMFALQDVGGMSLELPGLTVAETGFAYAIAKFDLTLALGDAPDGGFQGLIEYNSDLFDRSTVLRLARHLGRVLAAVGERPDAPLSEIELLTMVERHQILAEWNDTAAPFPEEVLIHQHFEAQADRAPEAVAAVWQGRALTYRELEARANRIARLLRGRGVDRGVPVGVWMERSLDTIAAVLGVLKAGGTYLPLDPAWPAERVETILALSEVPAVLTRSAHLGPLLELRWRVPALTDVVCLDEEAPAPPPEPVDTEAVRAVFDLVAERAVDRVTAGGFVSSFTGEAFSEAEVDEYRDRVLGLAAPWLGADRRVLEIGSGSGLLLWEIAPQVARLVGLDPSPLTQERNRAEAARRGLDHVELPVGFAHEIESWPDASFDLVILASTVQFFPGPLYLERIVSQALRLLAPGGALLIADVLDARRQEELRQAIHDHRAQAGLPPRQDPHKVLGLDEDLFHDLAAALPEAGSLSVLHRDQWHDNELRFRYDLVLTRSAEKRAETAGERRGRLWTSWHVEQAAAERLPAVAAPEDLAYVIHTSGSTGQPKGIVVQHRPVANLIAWINRELGVGPADRVLFVTSLCFDLSVWDIFGLLAAGGSIHVTSEEDLRDPERLVRVLLDEPITIWDSAPAALVRLAPLFPGEPPAEPAAGSRLRRVMLSGDWIPVTLPDRVRAAFPRAEITSLGGATEATVWSNWFPVGDVDPGWPSIPYGRPMPNARYQVLDAGLRPCPVGVPGDLYIGGDCLCVGYAHGPALTADSFIPDPFSARAGSRLYRTGDRARTFNDGNLEFLGRVDQQVKIRGFRIELGEIEVALARHPGVREAVVLAREDMPGDKRLVAYVTPAEEAAPEPSELRDFLRHSLPDYMVPAAFVALDHLPVTANGKLDRRALPAPRWEHGEEEMVAPRTPTEATLAALWCDVLGLERVSVHDSFFDLGGHSLLATQLVARLRETFGLEVQLRMMFQAPVLADLAAALDAELAKRAAAPSADSLPPLRPVPRGGLLPVSFAQQRLWFVERLVPGSALYNVPYAFRLRGPLCRAALAASLTAVERRHEALRTRFVERDGQPWQEILEPRRLDLPLVDLTGLPETVREAELLRLGRQEAMRPFDLATGSLLRAGLLRATAGEHVLLLSLHHIVSDGWSEEILCRELSALYAAALLGKPSALPALPFQYADFAAWQRAWPEEVLAGQVAYWTGRLAGLAPLELPADRPRPPVQTARGDVVEIAVPPPVAAALRGLGREHQATLFMVLLAAWQTLLHRLTGQTDVAVGSPIANRNQPEVRGLIGFFVNMLALRTDLGGAPGFRELLGRVRQVALAAYDHTDMPFERLVAELSLDRDLSRHPLVQVMFLLQNAAPEPLALPGIEASRLDVAGTIAKLDLTLWLNDVGEEGFTGAIEYNTDLFDRATLQRLSGHLVNLLAAVAATPEAPVTAIGLLTPAERHQIGQEWNDTSLVYAGRDACLHELIAAQAERTPDAVAVSFERETLTYRELDGRSGGLALHLRFLGVGAETLVGICAERSLEMVVGLLAILKAGGAYVPLDPAYPAERLAFMLEDAEVPVLLTQQALAGRLPENAARVVLLDGDPPPAARFAAAVAPEGAAYAIFTSGSTGRPKGVVNSHRGIVNRLLWGQARYGLTTEDRVLQKTPFSFDVSVWELFWPLIVGARLVVARPGGHQDPAYLADTIVCEGITTIHFVPSMLQIFVENDGLERCFSLRRVMASGEALPPELARRFHGRIGLPLGVALHNLYGPTEAGVEVASHACLPGETRVPIGRPVANTSLPILDGEGRPVAAGMAGELHIGGVQVARGYLRRPDLTAERFIPDPFGAPGSRLYRTGDLARFLPDGEIDYLGRIDHQVKIRGFRIELGEIEAVLTRHPEVREAVVLALGEGGDRSLVAYVVASSDGPDFTAGLRAHLRAELPEHMVPSAFVFLDVMPLSPNGKVDRRALPAPEGARDRQSSPYQAPTSQVGKTLAAIWSALLEVERVGAHDNFFETGGHSLLAIQLLARVREAFGVELPLRSVFQAPTLENLAALIEASRTHVPVPARPPIRRVSREGELPLSASQLRQWFLVQLDPESADYSLPLAFRLDGDLRPEALAAALREIVRRHETLRSTFVAVGGRPVARIAPEGSPEAVPPLPVIDLSTLPAVRREAEAHNLAEAELYRTLDLDRGPLVRTLLIRLAPRVHYLTLTVHHIVFDGFSTAVFQREAAALYEAAVSGQPSPLPELPVQYVDYSVWQQEWLTSRAAAEEVEHWKERLAGSSQVLDMPTDRPRPSVLSYQGEALHQAFPSALTADLRALAGREGTTIFMVLLAGYASLLSRSSGQEDINCGTFVANRRQEVLERLLGFFVNTLVLRVDLAGAPTFRELLARVREMSLEAFEHQEIPFERVLEEVETGRDLSRTPLFQVMFGVQNFASPTVQAPGVTLGPANLVSHSRMNGDLAFWIWEEGSDLTGWLQYSTDLLDAATAVRMFGQLVTLFAAGAAEPDLRLSELPLLPESERRQILAEWSVGGAHVAPPAPVHLRMREQARRTPEAPAVLAAGEALSYGELDRRAGRTARGLRRFGVGPDTVVGLCIDRSPEMIVALYGILGAGAAYLPLDPKLPAERLSLLLGDAGASLLLTRREVAAVLPELPARVLLVDQDFDDESGEGLPDIPVAAESTAYVLYTSGSTGIPKGVAVEHRAVAAFVEAAREIYGIGPRDRVLQFANLAFDTSVEEIYPCLSVGGTLLLRDEEMLASPSRFFSACRESRVTVLDLPTAYWHQLSTWVEGNAPELSTELRLVILGGERALPDRVRGWLAATGGMESSGLRLFNTYGPTEGTVVATACDLGEAAPDVPIGRPLRGVEAFILDRHQQPVPAGIPGEICLGGAGLARGYLGRPDLTADRFIPSPFGPAGARLYRTGDLGRWRSDGQIDFAGRADDQVKIRGFRIEPGEVAATLAQHAAVGEAVAIVREIGTGERRLAAYAVPAAEVWPEVSELRAFLGERLPAYMVPADIILLGAFPLTRTGKVDRQALPSPEGAVPREEGHAPPETVTEELLAEIWRQLLGADRVGIYDNFFDLGGHSLLAPQVLSRIEDVFQVELPLRVLFEAPTIAQMANAIEQRLLAQIEELSDEEAASLIDEEVG